MPLFSTHILRISCKISTERAGIFCVTDTNPDAAGTMPIRSPLRICSLHTSKSSPWVARRLGLPFLSLNKKGSKEVSLRGYARSRARRRAPLGIPPRPVARVAEKDTAFCRSGCHIRPGQGKHPHTETKTGLPVGSPAFCIIKIPLRSRHSWPRSHISPWPLPPARHEPCRCCGRNG